ncbi:CSS-motif domain-containing protein [Serratia liquefaciens]|uniref:CSS-motif domain-containing protein n=1 Tax=Serratia liquefaciens TaxID=614 RepID=UPI002179DCC8|nr:phage resistance protein [Serratia liquefaciens]
MLMTQLTVTKYRYYRWLLAGAVGLAILLLSLYTRYYQEIGTIEHNRQVLANRTVAKINNLLLPAEQQAKRSMPLLTSTCETVMPTLRFRAAQNQALRAMLLVKDGVIYCSSLFGSRKYVFSAILPAIANDGAKLARSWRCALRCRSPKASPP